MKHKYLIIILALVIILATLITAYVIKNSNTEDDIDSIENIQNYESVIEQTKSFSSNGSQSKRENKTTLKSNGEIKSALVEKIEPHASYYLEEVYVEENQFVSKGSNILKYTNGTYLTAPYDCIITKLNLPEENEKILNTHYVEVSSNNVLLVSINVDESKINKVSVGAEAKIEVTTLEKEYTGHVTNVASTASNGKFKVTIEFENDGSIKLGMTASVQMTI